MCNVLTFCSGVISGLLVAVNCGGVCSIILVMDASEAQLTLGGGVVSEGVALGLFGG